MHDALNWPPHISIGTGFKDIDESSMTELLNRYKISLKKFKKINIKVNGFLFTDKAKISDTIRSQYSIALKVEKN